MTEDSNTWLPHELVTHVTAGCGAPGIEWLADLPDKIRELEKLWSIRVSAPFPAIEYNFVAPATADDGEEVVIKLAPPWDPVEIFSEAAYLRSRDGASCVRLLAEDHTRKAILLERVVPGESLAERFKDRESESVEPAIEVLRSITRVCTGAETHIASLDGWFDGLRKYVGTAFPPSYAEKALRLYDELRCISRADLYLHGDYHPGNIVTCEKFGFVAIDPKGLRGNIGYEIGVFLNNLHWWQEKRPDVRERLRPAVEQFAAAFDLTPLEVRQWAYAQMVIGAWWNFIDMPSLYDGAVVKADIWDV